MNTAELDAQQQAPGTVLFVDDEQNILSSLRRLFRPVGYRVLVAANGPEGLALLEKDQIDVVVSDMRMPEMSGAEFLARIAQRWPQTMRILLTGYSDLESTVEAVNKGHIYRYVSKPWDDNDLKLTVHQALEVKRLEEDHKRLLEVTRQQNQQLKEFNTSLETMVKARTEEIQQTADMLDLAYKELRHSYVNSIPVFANLIEMREGNNTGHSRRVGELARALAERMALHEDEVQNIYFAGLLHDVGKLGLPDSVISKPFADLNRQERALVVKHPVMGQGALVALDSLETAGRIIRAHHERYDGKGYPDGLVGKDIPLGARIIAVANDFDALQLGKLSDQPLSSEEAARHIETHTISCYDPDVVKVFLAWLKDNPQQGPSVMALAVPAEKLRQGMVLARDLFNSEGILLLSRGHFLTDKLIARIRVLERDEDTRFAIYIQHERGDGDAFVAKGGL